MNTKEKYQDFAKWVSQNKEKIENKTCLQVWDMYNRIHGSSSKFRKFFKHLTRKERADLIPTVQTKHDGRFAPFCYQEEANCFWGSSVLCNYHYNESKCPMLKNNRILKRALKKFSNFLYAMRSQFIHSGRIPIFASPLPKDFAGRSSVYDYYETRDYEGLILINLKSDLLYALLVKYLAKMFDTYLKGQQ